jgi:hypothetical protein
VKSPSAPPDVPLPPLGAFPASPPAPPWLWPITPKLVLPAVSSLPPRVVDTGGAGGTRWSTLDQERASAGAWPSNVERAVAPNKMDERPRLPPSLLAVLVIVPPTEMRGFVAAKQRVLTLHQPLIFF